MKREFVIPIALVAVVAIFFVVQVIDTQKDSPAPVEQPAVSPQGSAAETTLAGAKATDTVALIETTPNVTVQPSDRPAPRIDTPYVRELIREGSPGTYLRDLLAQQGNRLMRWPDRFSAMRVYIERDVSLADWDPQYPVMAERTFEEWQQAGFPLRFDMVLQPTEVDIRIKWIDRFADGQKIGQAEKVRDQHGWLLSAEIMVATHDSAGKPLTPELVAGIVRHEVGHALGLGHSASPSDVMYTTSTTTVISASDRKTLRLLYLLPPGKMP